MSDLVVVKQELFCGVECDFYRNDTGEVFMTSTQLGKALNYTDPRKGISKIVGRHPYLTNMEFSGVTVLTTPSGVQETRVFTEDGIYEVSMISETSRAQEFRRWVRMIIKGLKKNNMNEITQTFSTIAEAIKVLSTEVATLRSMVMVSLAPAGKQIKLLSQRSYSKDEAVEVRNSIKEWYENNAKKAGFEIEDDLFFYIYVKHVNYALAQNNTDRSVLAAFIQHSIATKVRRWTSDDKKLTFWAFRKEL
jgi:prophage antirepressor-like protein